ncbi:DNA-binding response regulator [Streptomyces sp. NPDC001455]|uniref:DNA-binding response regulator n=1 Tax=Streptomyces sp. NPDC001455 TaxID=3154518 RepID=UPI003321B105
MDARTAPPVRIRVAKVVDRMCRLALRRTRVAAPDSRTVLVVKSMGVHALTAVAPLGVSAVLLHAEATHAADVVATVAAGAHRLPSGLRDEVLEVSRRSHPLGRPRALMSPHEADILRLVAQGGTAADVARAGYATERGALTMLSRLATRLGVDSRAGLVSYAYRHHLV